MKNVQTAAVAALATITFALAINCQTSSPDETDQPVAEEPGEADETMQGQGNEPPEGHVEPSQHSADLMELIADYEEWSYHAGVDTHTPSGHPGDVWVIAYANEAGVQMVEQQQVPALQGTIFVKEEYDADGADEPYAVTVMEKLSDEQGDWYWMKTDPDLNYIVETPEGMVLEGTEDLGCIGCHAASAHQDYVMAPQF